jgi:hypothetical protein
MTTETMPTPVKNSPRSHHKFVTFLHGIAQGLTNNKYSSNPDPSGAEVKAMADAMADATAKSRGGGTAALAARDKVRGDAEKLVDRVVLFVGINVRLSGGDAATATDMIVSTGLSIRQSTTLVKGELTPKYGHGPGEVMLEARAVAKVAVYMFEHSLDGHTWTAVPQSLVTRVHVSGLTPATVYYFRFRAQTRKGMTEYSSVVSFIVH